MVCTKVPGGCVFAGGYERWKKRVLWIVFAFHSPILGEGEVAAVFDPNAHMPRINRQVRSIPAGHYSPRSRRSVERAWPVAGSHSMSNAAMRGSPLAASNFEGMEVRKRSRTSSFWTPMIES